MHKRYILSILLLTIIHAAHVNAQSANVVIVADAGEAVNINSGIEALEDIGHNIFPDSAFKSKDFKVLPDGIPNKNITTSAFWFRLAIRNETGLPQLVLKLSGPALDSVTYYEQVASGSFQGYYTGQSRPFAHRQYLSSDYLFTVHIPPHSEKTVYLHISSNTDLILPLAIGAEKPVLASDKNKDIFWGIYIGIMIAMLLYNGFVYIATKDKTYLYYIIYMLAVLVTQITISGYAFQLLWPDNLWMAKYSPFFNPVFSGIAAIEFIRHFLKIKTFLPRADKIFTLYSGLYVVGLMLAFTGKYAPALGIIDMSAGTLSLYVLAVAGLVVRKGYKPAKFFLLAWSLFLIGVFIFVFKNFGILPYNNFTIYTMPVGSAMEALLLSFALADRINMLKKEVAVSQLKELRALQENERIVQEQNVMLEAKVNERTTELKLSNDGLNKAMAELKNAQAQLVESEKMATLGQLTAGVAHEINNPVNFITSNIKPLNRDVQMLIETTAEMEQIMRQGLSGNEMQKKANAYKNNIDYEYLKQEIQNILDDIGAGAFRTAEIVQGLRIFSRLDEGDLKKVDVNDGIDATLAITGNLFTNSIKVEKKYAAIPLLECYPGQVNQLFLNIISNAVYAIKKKFGGAGGGLLIIATSSAKNNIIISITDNGIGMDEQTKKKIFEPFFTTNEAGKGAGLGLSIAFNIVNKHNGQITVNSKVGEGSEFIITLPVVYIGH